MREVTLIPWCVTKSERQSLTSYAICSLKPSTKRYKSLSAFERIPAARTPLAQQS